MGLFHYVAINPERKELSGVIEATTEAHARTKLNDLGLSIISLTETPGIVPHDQHKETAQKNTFEFEGFDKNGKKVIGTIVADDQMRAYSRLFEEYQLNLTYLVNKTANADEKKQARQLGIGPLQEKYQATIVEKQKKKQQALVEEQMRTKEQQELGVLVEQTTGHINAFLQKYTKELKQEEFEVIQSYLNQLMRIKDSTNVEHIRTTCTRMLEHLQKQEIFINEQGHIQESAQLKLETKNMLDELKRTGLHKEITLEQIVESLENKPIIGIIARLVKHATAETDPEIKKMKNELKAVNTHLRSYWNVLLVGPTNTLRREAFSSIKTLRREKARLKLLISSRKNEVKQALRANEPSFVSLFSAQAPSIVGWLLIFYLAAYIISYPFTIKQTGLSKLPAGFYFFESTFSKPITLLLFFLYTTVTSRRLFLSTNTGGIVFGLYFGGFIAVLLIFINLL